MPVNEHKNGPVVFEANSSRRVGPLCATRTFAYLRAQLFISTALGYVFGTLRRYAKEIEERCFWSTLNVMVRVLYGSNILQILT